MHPLTKDSFITANVVHIAFTHQCTSSKYNCDTCIILLNFTLDGSSKAISCFIDFGFPYISYCYELKPYAKLKTPRKPLLEE